MKKFKRIVALLLAGVLALSVLTGCSLCFHQDEEGEAIKELALGIMNEGRDADDQLEIDKTMSMKLLSMLNKLDPDTGELDAKNAYERRLTGGGTQYQEYEIYMVDVSDEPYFLYEGEPMDECEAYDWRGNLDNFSGWFEYVKGALEDVYHGYDLTAFGFAYKVLYDSEGNDHLCIAFAFKVEGAPMWNIPEWD